MKFYKIVLGAFLGTLIALVITFFIKVGVISSMVTRLSKTEATAEKLKPNSVLYMKLDYEIPDRTSANEFGGFDYSTMQNNDVTGMNDILRNIEHAAIDDQIKGIYLDLSSIPTSPAILQEIRNKLVEFKESGKFIVSYAETYSQTAYYLASVSDKIYMNPGGMLDLHGMASQIMFYKHLLEKLDIEMQIVRGPDNKYKSAVEPYFLDKMSEANREQMDTLLGSIWGQIIGSISESRNISVAQLNQIADSLGTVFDAEKAMEYGLVDSLYYKDQLITELKNLTSSSDDVNIIGNSKYAKTYHNTSSSTNELAVIFAEGQINSGKGAEGTIGSETLSKTIREAREDKDIKAIVLRVNSPGGSALASEVIGREVELAAKEKPVIISMGNYAASGGYWISANGNYIFADPTTLTGSIGVFGTFPNMQGFFNDKLGLTFDVAKTNENADFGSVAQPLTEFQYNKLQQSVIKTYNDFTSLVAGARGLRQTYVDSIGQGRVWSGADAIGIGLVDQLGGIEDAINYAAEKAGIKDNYKIKEMPSQKDFMTTLMEQFSGTSDDKVKTAMKNELGEYYRYFEGLKNLSNATGIQARIPFDMVIE